MTTPIIKTATVADESALIAVEVPRLSLARGVRREC
jgi:hypothetical protein